MKNTLVKKTLIGYRKARPGETGQQPIWLAQGGSEDANDDGGAGDDSGNSDGGDDGDDGGEGDSGEEEGKGSKASREKTVPEAKYLQIKKHLAEADRKKQEALDELKKLQTKDLPEAEKLTAERDEAVESAKTYRGRFEKLARTNAFLMASGDLKLTWASTTAALKLAELEDLEINDDGSVDGIKDAVQALAKEHPYLLAPSEGKEKKDPPKSGSVVGSTKRGTKTKQEISEEDLRKRFAALR